MIVWLRHFLGWAVSAFRSREDIILENLALRQQLLALHPQRPRRRLTVWHKEPQRFLIFDRDAKFSADVVSTAKAMGGHPIRTAFRSPWQNGVAERWVGSVRRDLLDHVIVLNRRHLRRLLNEYVRYYHEDRTHLGLGKDTPAGRGVLLAPSSGHKVISLPRLGGLHHRYTIAA